MTIKSPRIDWYLKDIDDFIQTDEFYLGSFNPETDIILEAQVWNNRYGQTEVQSLPNARLDLYFENIEDSIIFNYCTVLVNNTAVNVNTDINRLTASIGELSGEPNNGIASEKNKSNYKQIKVIFSNLPKNLKNGLKNMFLDIEID